MKVVHLSAKETLMDNPPILQFLWAMLLVPLFAAGCSLFNKAPMDVLKYDHPKSGAKERLIVFMRGMGGNHRSFEKEGLVADICDRMPPFDVVAPNAHYGYYADRSLMRRMKEDVIDPAHAQGYKQIWLIGFSMGGLGALLYTIDHPEDVQGIYLVAPFLGYPSLLKEIEKAGGVSQWDPGTFNPHKQWQRMLWQWLKQNVAEHPHIPIYLGYGRTDRYVEGQQLLAQILPSQRVFTVPGGHDYESFRSLWKMFLQNGGCYACPLQP